MAKPSIDLKILKKIPLFSSLSDAELKAVLGAPENGVKEYKPKDLIIREAEVADSMYVILEGAVEVSLKGDNLMGREVTIATLRPGDFFGEQAFTDERTMTGRRSANVRAVTDAKLFRIDRKYAQLGLQRDAEQPDNTAVVSKTTVMKRPKAVDQTSFTDTAKVIRRPMVAPPGAPSAESADVRRLLQGMRLFQSLTESELSRIESWTQVIGVGPGDFVLKESEKGDCMYVVLEGTVEIFTTDDDGRVLILATHNAGNYFGEQALMPGSTGTRSAYARTVGLSKLIKIPKEYFRLVLNRDSEVLQTLLKSSQAQKKQRTKLKEG